MINVFGTYLEDKICPWWNLVKFVLMYTFLLCIFIIFYYIYLKISRFAIYFENSAKSKREEQKKIKRV